MSAPAWVQTYLGIPWEETHCWDLVRRVLAERFGLSVPSYRDRYTSPTDADAVAAVVRAERQGWPEVRDGEEQAGDVVLLRLVGQPVHVGLVVAPGDMLHTLRGLGARLERYRTVAWRRRIVGFHRHPDLEAARG